MLNPFQNHLANHIKAAVSSFHTLCARPFSFILTLLVIAAALMVPSIFWVLSTNAAQATKSLRQSGEINLYLKPSASKESIEETLKAILKEPNVGKARLISAEEGLQLLENQDKASDLLKYLPENPIPPVIVVTPATTVQETSQIENLYDHLKQITGVAYTQMHIEWQKQLHSLLNFFNTLTQSFLLLLTVAVVFIISTTLRLNLHQHREEIRVLKLIGASDTYIIRPYLYAGFWYGLGAALITILFVNFFILASNHAAYQLTKTFHISYALTGLSVQQAYCVLLFSVLLGWFAAYIAVKKQVTFIEPYN